MKKLSLIGLVIFAIGCGEAPNEDELDVLHEDTITQDFNATSKPSRPTSIKLYSPSTSPNKDRTPTLKVAGVKSGNYVYLYKTTNCSGASIKSIKATSTTASITTSTLSTGTYKFSAKQKNSAGYSTCRGYVTYVLDYTVPAIPTVTSHLDNDLVSSTATIEGDCESNATVYFTGDISPTTSTTCTSGNYSKTVTLTSGDGSKTISLRQKDKAGNYSSYQTLDLIRDTVAPTATINQSSGQIDPTNNQVISFDVVFSKAIDPDSFSALDITNFGSASGVVWDAPITSDNISWTLTTSSISTDGSIIAVIGNNAVNDIAGNGNASSISSDNSVTYDTSVPTVSIGTPSPTSIAIGNVDYAVTYGGASTVNLTIGDVTVNTTGTVTYSVSVIDGSTGTPTIRVNVTGGDGNIDSVSIAAGTSQNLAGNYDTGASQGANVAVDNTASTVSIGTPSANTISTGAINYAVTYTGASSINLAAGDVTVNATGTVTFTKFVAGGTTATPTITVTVTGGDGTIDSITIAAGTSSDNVGNTDAGASQGANVTVDNTAPTISLASVSDINSSNVSNISLSGTCSENGATVSITAPSSISGSTTCASNNFSFSNLDLGSESDGSVTFTVRIQDSFGNSSTDSDSANKDVHAPTVSIGTPSTNLINIGDVSYAVTYTGASSINLTNGNVTVNTTGTVTYSVNIADGTTVTPTITVSVTGGDGSIDSIAIAAATSTDAVGNADIGSSQLIPVVVDNNVPTVSIGTPSTNLISTGDVSYTATYTGASSINLTNGNVTVNTTGTVTYSVNVTNGTTATPTITVSVTGGDGSIDSIAIAAGTSQDIIGNADIGSSENTAVTIDNTPSTVSIGSPSVTSLGLGGVDYAVTYTGASTINLLAANVTVNTTGSVTFTKLVSGGTTATPTITVTITGGDGTVDSIAIAAGTSQDALGNTDTGASEGTDVTVDNTGPSVSIGAPSSTLITTGNIDYAVTYTGATTINLLAANVTVNTTGTVTFTKSVIAGTTATPTIRVSITGGDGTVDSIAIAAATSQDSVGNTDGGSSEVTDVTVDNSAPNVSIGAPNTSNINVGDVDYAVTYTGATSINLIASNVTVNTTGSVTFTKSVIAGTTATPTIRVSITGGDGTVDSIAIAAGTSSDAVGNTDAGASEGTDVTVDNTGPSISIGTPSVSSINTGNVDYAVTYTGATSVNLIASNITVNTSGTVTFTKSVIGGTSVSPTIRIIVTGGNGTIDSIAIAAATSQDSLGNADTGASEGTDVTVDNTAPTVSIGAPNVSSINTGDVDYAVTYTGASTINLLAANVTVNTTGTVTFTKSVISGTTATPTIRISITGGDGTVDSIAIAAATSSDAVGNTDAGDTQLISVTVDNTVPTVVIGAPSVLSINTGDIDYAATYTGASTINLLAANVTVNTTGSVTFTKSVISGTTATPTIRVSITGGDGTVDSIAIAAATSSDAIGNTDAGASEGTDVTVDNTASTVSIGAPSVTSINIGDVDYAVTYTDASTINLLAANVTVNTTGSVTFTKSIIAGTTATPTIRISITGGDGTVDSIAIAAGTSNDSVGNSDAGASEGTDVTVDNTAPTVVVGTPSVTSINTGDIDYGVIYTGASTINLLAANVTVNTTGSVTFTKSIIAGTTATPTIRVSITGGDGTVDSIAIAAGTSSDTLGNADVGASEGTDVTVDNTVPTILIGTPSITSINIGDVDYGVTYTGASTTNLLAANVTVNTTGSVTFTKSVISGTTATPTIRISITGGDGTVDSISIAAGTSSDAVGNSDAGASEGTDVSVDNTAPTVVIGSPSLNTINTGDIDYGVTYTGASTINLLAANVTVNTTGSVTFTKSVISGTTATPTIRISITGGDGTVDSISIAAGTSSDTLGNADVGASEGTDVSVDNTAPTILIGAPSTTSINTGDVDYAVTYTGASTINLLAANVTVNTTGSVTFTKSVIAGTTATPTIRISITGGDGTVDSITIAAATSQDNLGNTDAGASESTDVTVDNTAPTVSIGGPSVTTINTGDIDYAATYSNASTINLLAANVTVNTTGSVTFTKSVIGGTTATPTIRISITGGDGTVDSIAIAAGTSSDAVGNTDAGDTQLISVSVDNTAPTVSIGTPSITSINIGDVDYAVTYTGASTINLLAANVTVNTTGSVTFTKSIIGGTTATPTIRISITGGDGTVDSIAIAAGTSQDTFANADVGASEGTDVTVDNTAPTVSIGTPNVTSINTGDVDYAVTYSNASTINLLAANVTVNTTGSVTFTKSVIAGTTATPTIRVSITSGDGSIDSIAIAAATSSDAVGNTDAGASEGTDVTVDNTAPTVSIGTPNVTSINTGDVDYAVTYSGASTINLASGNITVNTTGSVTFTKSVIGGTTATPTIRISITGGDGSVDSIAIVAGTSSDTIGNTDSGASEGTDVTVDNTVPTVSIGAPSTTALNTGDVDYAVTYSGASTINLLAANVTVNTTGTVTFTKSVIAGTTATPTIRVAITGGDGTIDSISIAAATSSDAIGNNDTGASQGTDVTVDNTGPSVSIGAPSTTALNTGDVDYAVTYSNASTINLLTANVTVNVTGTVTFTKSVIAGTTATPTIRVAITGGDGTIDSIAIAAATSSDAVGNSDAGASQGTDVTVDNTAPTVSIGTPSVTAISTGNVDYAVTYTGASSINLVAANVIVNVTGTVTFTKSVIAGTTATPTIRVAITSGDGTIDSISIAAATSSDAVGNSDTGGSQGADVTVDNTVPTISIGVPSPTSINTGNVDYAVTYTDASTINLLAANVTVNVTGTVTFTKSVIAGTTATPTIRVAITGGDGTVDSISIAAGTSTDAVGNSDAGASQGADVTVDNSAPTVAITGPMSYINDTNKTSYAFSGTCSENGTTVTITGPGAASGATAACSSNAFSFSGLNVSSIPDGTVGFTVSIQDALANSSTDNDSATKDTVVPSISSLTLSSPATSPGNDTTPTIQVAGTFPIGDNFELFSDATCTTSTSSSVAASGANSVLITSTVLSVNTTYAYFAKGTDTVGNTSCSGAGISVNYTLDTVVPTITNGALSAINNANKASYSFSGTCTASGDGINLTSPVLSSTTCSGGAFTFSGLNLTGVSDGSVTFTVGIADTAGNTGSDSDSATKDTINPTITNGALTYIVSGNMAAYSFSGTCSENSQTVTLSSPVSTTTTCSGGAFTFSSLNLSALGQGNHTFTTSIADIAGNTGSDSDTGVKDTVAPTTPVCVSAATDGTPSKSNTQTWTGSTDATSGINYYEMSLGISTAADTVAWASIGSTVAPYQFTGISPVLLYETLYRSYIRVRDNAGNISSTATCSQWELKRGYGVFKGTQTTNSTTLNQATAYALQYSASSFNSQYFTHSTSSNSQNITIQYAGNYLLSLNVPVYRTGTASSPGSLIANVKVNGTAVNRAISANSITIGNTTNPRGSSNHITVLLEGLAVNDVITIETANNALVTNLLTVPAGKQFSTVLEYIPNEAEIFTATGSTVVGGSTNLNPASSTKILWTESIKDATYTHSNVTNAENITIATAGNYLVSVNVPVTGAVTRAKPSTTIFVGNSSSTTNNGTTTIDASAFITNTSSHIVSSANYTNIIYGVTAGQVLDVRQIATTAGTLTVPVGKVASIYIQKLDTSADYIIMNGTTTSWNTVATTNIGWTTEKEKDASLFTHSTSSNTQNVTVTTAGDYMLFFSDYITSNTAYVNPTVYVLINGVATPVGVCKGHHNYSTAALRPMSCNLQTMLTLSASDVVSMTTILDVVTGTASNSAVPRLTIRKISN